jgi:hypothetical protein
MRDIARLLFGGEAAELLDLITGESGEERDMADRARRSGEWCGSTPGHGQAGRADRVVLPSPGARRVSHRPTI